MFDRAFSALVLDLEARGLLDETLVLCMSAHGRTPKLDPKAAGGGMGKGNLVGRTDAIAGDVRDTPVSPKDVLATAFHLLGIDPSTTTVADAQGRPYPIAGDGEVRRELLG